MITRFEACLLKLADVTRQEAQRSLERLEGIDAGRPTGGQLARGALVGSIAGPVASNLNRLIGKGEFHSPREIAGQIAGGLIMGTAVPLAKREVDAFAERKVLNDYASSHGGQLAQRITDRLEST